MIPLWMSNVLIQSPNDGAAIFFSLCLIMTLVTGHLTSRMRDEQNLRRRREERARALLDLIQALHEGRTLEESLSAGAAAAKIVSVNSDLGFVVVDFASRTVPTVGTRVSVYRGDKRIGAVRITEPVHSPLATADIVEGEVRVGDEAR